VMPAPNAPRRRAVFLDRDGTIIEDVSYLRDPNAVRLLPGAATAIKQLNDHKLLAIVVTNQSGIARGLVSRYEYQATEQRVDELLAKHGARLDAHYFCPHLPELTGPCDCRKPGVLLYSQAAEHFNIDLGSSWWVGDRLRDVLPAEVFHAQGILLHCGVAGTEAQDERATSFAQADDLAAAVDMILHEESQRRSG
jgi:D-glycero-D-manno-heptose 1,7-bisphosphate phosphatase